MPRSFSELREYMSELVGLVPVAQFDVMDGKFVPETSWPYASDGLGTSEVPSTAGNSYEAFERIAEERELMPEWMEIDFEADLMIARPEKEVEKWLQAGARRIIIHIESVSGDVLPAILSVVHDYMRQEQELDGFHTPTEIGLAINIDTPNQKLLPWIRDISFVQCMGIAQIGYQGQPFDARVLNKIHDLRERAPDVTISVDGGVNAATAPQLVRAGANRLVSGSAIWRHESGDVETAISELQDAVNQYND